MKYVPGLLVGQLSGKAGNTVASRNRNGSFMRTRVMPKLVRNAKTTAVRSAFTDLSQSFRDLTATQIAGWNALGAEIKKRNSLGVAYDLTGLQVYKSLNQRNKFIGNPVLSSAPAFAAAPDATGSVLYADNNATIITTPVVAGATSEIQNVTSSAGVIPGDLFDDTTASVTANVIAVIDATHVQLDAIVTTVTADSVTFKRSTDFLVAFSPTPIPAGVTLLIYATAPLSKGVTRPSKSAFRFITGEYVGTATNVNISAAYAAVFGQAPVESNVFARFVYVTDSGFAGTPFEALAFRS